MVGRIIDQYVDAVTQQLPIGVRKSVERKLKDTIYDKLDEYTNGQRAVSRDVRAVLREMGSPDEIVNAYSYARDNGISIPKGEATTDGNQK